MLINRVGGGGEDARKPVTNGKIEEWKASTGGNIPANTFVQKTTQIQPGSENLHSVGKIIETSVKAGENSVSLFRFPDEKVGVVYLDTADSIFVEVFKPTSAQEVVKVASARIANIPGWVACRFCGFVLSNTSFAVTYLTGEESSSTRKIHYKVGLFSISGSSISATSEMILNTVSFSSSGTPSKAFYYEGCKVDVYSETHFVLLEKELSFTLTSNGTVTSVSYSYNGFLFNASSGKLVQKKKTSIMAGLKEDRGSKLIVGSLNGDYEYQYVFVLIGERGKLNVANLDASDDRLPVYKYYETASNPEMLKLTNAALGNFGGNICVLYRGHDTKDGENDYMANVSLFNYETTNNASPLYGIKIIKDGQSAKPFDSGEHSILYNPSDGPYDTMIFRKYGSTIDFLRCSTRSGADVADSFEVFIQDFNGIGRLDYILAVPLSEANFEQFAVFYFKKIGSILAPDTLVAAFSIKGKEEEVMKPSTDRIDGITKDEITTSAKGEVWMLDSPGIQTSKTKLMDANYTDD